MLATIVIYNARDVHLFYLKVIITIESRVSLLFKNSNVYLGIGTCIGTMHISHLPMKRLSRNNFVFQIFKPGNGAAHLFKNRFSESERFPIMQKAKREEEKPFQIYQTIFFNFRFQ